MNNKNNAQVSKKDKDRRKCISISLTETEKERLMEKANAEGLSLSAFLRLAANKYIAVEQEKEV